MVDFASTSRARDGRAHGVERHFFVGDALVERLDLRGDALAAIAGAAACRAAGDAVSTSAATMRPCGPEPLTCARSMPRSPASRRASGVTTAAREPRRPVIALGRADLAERIQFVGRRLRWPRTGPVLGPDPGFRGGERARFRWRNRSRRLARRLAARPVSPLPPEITATTAPTWATSPTWKLMSVSVPAVVAGTSIEVLSVSISNRLSPGLRRRRPP